MFVLRSTCFQAPCHVYAQIYMPIVFFAMFMLRSTCQCLDLCVYVLRAMLLCLDLCSYAQIYMFMCFVLCLCAWIYVGCYAICYFSPFCHQISLFLAFWPFWWGVDLDPMVQAYIRTPRPILKGLDHFLLHVVVCLLASMLYLLVSLSRSRLCHALCLPWVCACVVTSVPPRVCLDVTICDIHFYGISVLAIHLSSLRATLICLLCATLLAFLVSMLSLHACLHVHA